MKWDWLDMIINGKDSPPLTVNPGDEVVLWRKNRHGERVELARWAVDKTYPSVDDATEAAWKHIVKKKYRKLSK